jgi:hypothetical protein
MNNSDWASLTGSSLVGMGPVRRPPHPKLVAQLVGKSLPSSRTRSRDASDKAYRKMALALAKLTAPSDFVPAQYRTRAGRAEAYRRALAGQSGGSRRASLDYDPGIMEQSQVGAIGLAAIDQHTEAVRRAIARVGRTVPYTPKWGLRYWP